jgi:hypothetical protein
MLLAGPDGKYFGARNDDDLAALHNVTRPIGFSPTAGESRLCVSPAVITSPAIEPRPRHTHCLRCTLLTHAGIGIRHHGGEMADSGRISGISQRNDGDAAFAGIGLLQPLIGILEVHRQPRPRRGGRLLTELRKHRQSRPGRHRHPDPCQAGRIRLDRRPVRLREIDAAQCGSRLLKADHRVGIVRALATGPKVALPIRMPPFGPDRGVDAAHDPSGDG